MKMHSVNHWALPLLGLASACVVPNPALSHGDEAAEASETSGNGTSAPSSDDEAGDSGMDGNVSDSGTGTMTGESSGADSGSETSETGVPPDVADEPVCPLVSEAGDACQTCVDLNCCNDVESCQVEEDCTCFLDCLLGGSTSALCEVTCGVSGVPSLMTTLECLDQHCSEDCPNTV